ncbi:MAG: bifunctional phosphoribosylaminoimidazolecarboxamide formyltransferase/IMP cyclohydrolase [Acidobacteria bacterium]|nr:bifunctional phosphoribosylaminoimidazolecarboxamide formyltransferase/IMP cyclohydrolase [Acidobacteriota bacterium]
MQQLEVEAVDAAPEFDGAQVPGSARRVPAECAVRAKADDDPGERALRLGHEGEALTGQGHRSESRAWRHGPVGEKDGERRRAREGSEGRERHDSTRIHPADPVFTKSTRRPVQSARHEEPRVLRRTRPRSHCPRRSRGRTRPLERRGRGPDRGRGRVLGSAGLQAPAREAFEEAHAGRFGRRRRRGARAWRPRAPPGRSPGHALPRGRDPAPLGVRGRRLRGRLDRARGRDGLRTRRPRDARPLAVSRVLRRPVRGARDARRREAPRRDRCPAPRRRRHADGAPPRVDVEDGRRRRVDRDAVPRSERTLPAVTSRLALLSVSDRTGLVDFARALVAQGFGLLSTGGTAQHLSAAGLAVTNVSDLTGFPEVFGGRVKTLHPKLFGGILFDRSEETHRAEARENGVGPIDLVVVNLYPFEDTVAKTGSTFAQAIEKIDVGGPSLLRAAAKNHAHVGVVCDPADYPAVAAELAAHGGALTDETRTKLAAKVFRRTAAYDAAIARWISGQTGEPFPERLSLSFARASSLRYGENPHQKASLYADAAAPPAALSRYAFVQGKELSYNNFLDADAALYTSRVVGPDALTIVKHRIPSGAATGATMAGAFEAAWASDPIAGFGGVVACTGTLDAAAASALTSRFLEVVVVHAVTEDAKPILARKPNLRVLTVTPEAGPRPRVEVRGIDGGLLVQEGDLLPDEETAWKVVTKRAPTEAERRAMRFANLVLRGVVSNGIVVAGGTATYGIGGGRTSRVDACRDAAGKAGERARGAVAASDAFFPFPDGLEVLTGAGVTAVIQPGGSVKDPDVIAAADAAGIAMVFTGKRHFRH